MHSFLTNRPVSLLAHGQYGEGCPSSSQFKSVHKMTIVSDGVSCNAPKGMF
jgi:hypothetical protein